MAWVPTPLTDALLRRAFTDGVDTLPADWVNTAATWLKYAHHGVYNVLAKGALPGASAAVNTAAFQATADAMPSTGGIYLIPSGLYDLNDEITFTNKSGILFSGAGIFGTTTPTAGTAIRQTATNKAVFSLSGCQGLTFRDFSSYASSTTGTTGFKLRAACNNISFESLYLMSLDTLFDLSGSNTEIFWRKVQGGQGTTAYGIKIADGQDYYIRDSFFPTANVDGKAIYIAAAKWVSISGCELRDSGYGVYLDSTTGAITHIRITDNTLGGLDRAAIFFNATTNDITTVIVNANDIDECALDATIAGTPEDAHISGSGSGGGALQDITITSNKFTRGAARPYYGIYLANLGMNIIRDNDLKLGYFTTPMAFPSTASGFVQPRGNTDYITENSGTGTIANGATTAVITHGLSVTPVAANISVTPTGAVTNDPGNIYVDTIGATQFTVHCRNDPGASGMAFSWQAVCL